MPARGRRLGRGAPFQPKRASGLRSHTKRFEFFGTADAKSFQATHYPFPFQGQATMGWGVSPSFQTTGRFYGQFAGSAGTSLYIEEPGYNPTLYPNGVKRPYRITVRDSSGAQYGELANFRITSINWALSDTGSCTFTIPAGEATATLIKEEEREIQVWRGTQIIFWGVILKTEVDTSTGVLTVQCPDLSWYFTTRHFGRAQRKNMLNNPDFEQGSDGRIGWVSVYAHWFLDIAGVPYANAYAAPAGVGGAPTAVTGTRSMRMYNPSPPDFPEAADIPDVTIPIVFQDVIVYGGNNGRRVTFTVWNYTPSGTFVRGTFREWGAALAMMPYGSDGPVAGGNDGGIWRNIQASGSPTTYYFNAGFPPTNPFVVDTYRNLYTQSIQVVNTVINKDTPKDRWQRHIMQIDIPPGATRVLHARIECPKGVTFWDHAQLTWDEAFENVTPGGDDQADLIRRMVEHAQDANYDKSNLNIGTNCQPNGVKRIRHIPFADHTAIWDSISEFATLYDGMDFDFTWPTPTTRQFNSYYPTKGTRQPDVVFELGKNISKANVKTDGGQTANVVIVVETSNDADRDEAGAKDLTVFANGLTVERIFNSTPGSLISTLENQAVRGLSKYKRKVIVPELTVYDPTGHLFARLGLGNIHWVRMNYGWLQVNEEYRIVAMTHDPNTEETSLTLNQLLPGQ